MSTLLHFSDLDRRRRLALKTLRELSHETGLQLASVWNVLHGKCPDVRKIVAICKALGVSPKRLDWESFIEERKDPGRGASRSLLQPPQKPSERTQGSVCPPGRCALAKLQLTRRVPVGGENDHGERKQA